MSNEIFEIEGILRDMGLKKADLYTHLDVSSQTYNNWRTRGIPSKYRQAIAEYLGLDLSDFLKGKVTRSNRVAEPGGEYTATTRPEAVDEAIWATLPPHTKMLLELVLSQTEKLTEDEKKLIQLYRSAPDTLKFIIMTTAEASTATQDQAAI